MKTVLRTTPKTDTQETVSMDGNSVTSLSPRVITSPVLTLTDMLSVSFRLLDQFLIKSCEYL